MFYEENSKILLFINFSINRFENILTKASKNLDLGQEKKELCLNCCTAVRKIKWIN